MGAPSFVISLLRYAVITIPAAFILSRFLGAAGVWHAFWLAELCTAGAGVFHIPAQDGGAAVGFCPYLLRYGIFRCTAAIIKRRYDKAAPFGAALSAEEVGLT